MKSDKMIMMIKKMNQKDFFECMAEDLQLYE